jgi:hypothetical protein
VCPSTVFAYINTEERSNYCITWNAADQTGIKNVVRIMEIKRLNMLQIFEMTPNTYAFKIDALQIFLQGRLSAIAPAG